MNFKGKTCLGMLLRISLAEVVRSVWFSLVLFVRESFVVTK